MQAAMPCSIFASIWGLRRWHAGILMTTEKHCSMQMAGFMSSLPALMSQNQECMEFMKSAVRLWRIWRKRINLTWIISVSREGAGAWT